MRKKEMNYKKEAEKLKGEYAEADCGRLNGWCDTSKCPLWGDREGRVGGLCVVETYLHADGFIKGYKYDIHCLQMKIDTLRKEIGKLKSFKKRFEEYLEKRNAIAKGLEGKV